jgi:hypothetical protein
MSVLTVQIKLGNDAMSDLEDVAQAVYGVAEALREGYWEGGVPDANGNTVGRWGIVDETPDEPATVLIKATSHRARRSMVSALGFKPQCFFSWERNCTGGFYRLSPDQAAKVLDIKGISKAREGDDIHRCMDW